MSCFCKLQEPPIKFSERLHHAAVFRTNFVTKTGACASIAFPEGIILWVDRVLQRTLHIQVALQKKDAPKIYRGDSWYQIIRTIMHSTVIEIDRVGTKQLPSKTS